MDDNVVLIRGFGMVAGTSEYGSRRGRNGRSNLGGIAVDGLQYHS
jgi:hypothetical protein